MRRIQSSAVDVLRLVVTLQECVQQYSCNGLLGGQERQYCRYNGLAALSESQHIDRLSLYAAISGHLHQERTLGAVKPELLKNSNEPFLTSFNLLSVATCCCLNPSVCGACRGTYY